MLMLLFKYVDHARSFGDAGVISLRLRQDQTSEQVGRWLNNVGHGKDNRRLQLKKHRLPVPRVLFSKLFIEVSSLTCFDCSRFAEITL